MSTNMKAILCYKVCSVQLSLADLAKPAIIGIMIGY